MIVITVKTTDTGMYDYIKTRAESNAATYSTTGVMVDTSTQTAPNTANFTYPATGATA